MQLYEFLKCKSFYTFPFAFSAFQPDVQRASTIYILRSVIDSGGLNTCNSSVPYDEISKLETFNQSLNRLMLHLLPFIHLYSILRICTCAAVETREFSKSAIHKHAGTTTCNFIFIHFYEQSKCACIKRAKHTDSHHYALEMLEFASFLLLSLFKSFRCFVCFAQPSRQQIGCKHKNRRSLLHRLESQQ